MSGGALAYLSAGALVGEMWALGVDRYEPTRTAPAWVRGAAYLTCVIAWPLALALAWGVWRRG